DVFFGAGELGADGGGGREAHGGKGAGGDERGPRVVAKVRGLPHLVLAYVGDDDGFGEAAGGLGFAPDVVDDVRGVEVAAVGQVDDVADAGVTFHLVDLGDPACVGLFGDEREQRVEHLGEIADEGDVGANVLVDLGGVDLDVDLLGGGRVAGEVAGDAIVEAHAEG